MDNYNYDIIARVKQRSTLNDNGCIEYKATKHKYGLISITIDSKRKNVPAHRAMYMAVNDCLNLDSSVVIRHKCDNPRCVNIDHLESGTHKDNMQDCVNRGRKAKSHAYATRVRLHDDSKVDAIRKATGRQQAIADYYGVSVGYVSKIKAGKLKR